MIALILRYPLYAAALALTLALAGWHFQDKISDWWDGRTIRNLQADVAALKDENAQQAQQIAQATAATAAAQAARDRNDTDLPATRAAIADRIRRNPTAVAADILRDDEQALAAYALAGNRLRTESAR